MAGDWLKMELCTPDKPEVFAITTKMGWDNPATTVGTLFLVWRWFDQHTVDGNAPGVTLLLLDRISCVSGFGTAMQSVGWLEVFEHGISLPKFDLHTGNSAKNRCQTAKRVANHKGLKAANAESNALSVTTKSNAKSNGDSVTKSGVVALPREEKRREDITTASAVNKTIADAEQEVEVISAANAEVAAEIKSTFNQFWDAYPSCKRKGGKDKCFEIWKKKNLSDSIDLILSHLASQHEDHTKQDGQFCPATSVYLNAEGWDGYEDNQSYDRSKHGFTAV